MTAARAVDDRWFQLSFCSSRGHFDGERQVAMHAVIIVFYLVLIYEAKVAEATTQSQAHVRSALLELSHVNHGNETDNDLNEAQVDHIIKTLNRFRAIIQTSDLRFKSTTLTAANYRKVRYSNVFEAELKFGCDDIWGPEDFISDEYTWRRVRQTASTRAGYSYDWDPRIQEMLIDPFNHSILHAADEADTLRMALSPDVTEIGCFEKTCNGYKYIACKTGHIIDVDGPLHTPSERCEADKDCILPGYTRCDLAFGLCDLDPPDKKIVSPLVCLSLTSPRMPLVKEKCDGVHDTDSAISEAERLSIVNSVNEYRAMINNNCKLGLGTPKPASNYRKVKYSCVFESGLKFACSSSLRPDTFISDERTWRSWHHKNKNNKVRIALFHRVSPVARQLWINPDTATVGNGTGKAIFMKLFMSEDVTEVGCYVKVCGDYEYIACKSNHDPNVPNDAPLYTPGQRCNVDANCTLPDYHVCDANVGLCDYKSHYARKMETIDKCTDPRNIQIELLAETCNPGGYNTGSAISNLERSGLVYIINQYRALNNNNCNLGKGNVKPISNYRKVKYSCALEKEAKFDYCPISDSTLFTSDNLTLRVSGKVQTSLPTADFVYWLPQNYQILLDPYNQTIGATYRTRSFVNFMMSPNVTEFGCFIKVCGDYEYMACKTGHVVLAPKEKPLYTPGKRCMTDEDCTLPGYNICDVASGLCDLNPKTEADQKKPTVSPLICHSLESPRAPPLFEEKCNGIYETGSKLSQIERNLIVDSINSFRAMINNNCTLGLGIPNSASNYRKVKYSCALETDAMFECGFGISNSRRSGPVLTPESFTTSEQTWRGWAEKSRYAYRTALFHRAVPAPNKWLLYPNNQTVRRDMSDAAFMHFFMSADVTEVGCFVQVCIEDELIACKTNHDYTLPYDSPLYTPGQRCNIDADCTLPGYTTCDASVGLCDFKTHSEIKKEADTHRCDEERSVFLQRNMEKCGPGFNTGSNMSNAERELIVYTTNRFRSLINNNCNFGKGIVKQISNYRKVKYSCALEEDAKFECEDANSPNFKSDKYFLRDFTTDKGISRIVAFEGYSPKKEFMRISPDIQTLGTLDRPMIYARIMLSPEVTEIGCFIKVCGLYEFFACTTGHPVTAPENEPLYKPGSRCVTNNDCTLPGYGICDDETGLCETS